MLHQRLRGDPFNTDFSKAYRCKCDICECDRIVESPEIVCDECSTDEHFEIYCEIVNKWREVKYEE